MSRKELVRAGLVKAALAGRITNRQGADAVRLTVRQFQRLKRRFEVGGAPALCHESRGRPSPRRLPAPLAAQISQLMATTYRDFNDVHLTEKLQEVEGLSICRESVRRLRVALGRPAKQPRRPPRHRRRRAREASGGALVQGDGSPFAWLQDRGAPAALLGAVDDATGAILALGFRPAEDLHGYASLFARLFTTHGLPLAVYGDRLNVFCRNDAHWTLEEELAGAQPPTHLGVIFADLGVAYIAAHSPQAKGRIERLWRTLQDRLTSELRLRGIVTVEAAAAYLPAFIADYNRRFARPAAAPPVWRRPPKDLALVVSCRYRRVVGHDNTVTLGTRWAQLPRGPHGRSYAGCRVDVRELLDGRLLVLHEGARLVTQAAPPDAFVLTPRRRSIHERRRANARAPDPAVAPDRRSPPAPPPPHRAQHASAPRPSPRASRRPALDHPWNRWRRAKPRGMTFSRSSKG